MRRAWSAIRVSGFSVCRPISQPPAAATMSAMTTPNDIARTISACCARNGPSGAMTAAMYRWPACSTCRLNTRSSPAVCRKRRGRRRTPPIDGSDAAIQRKAPDLQDAAVGPRQRQRSIRDDDFDAGLLGGSLEGQPLAELRSHDAFERGHGAREIVVQALQREPGLRERADDRACHQDHNDDAAVPEREARSNGQCHES